MKHLEDTPLKIAKPEWDNFCIYIDTDSNYFGVEKILKHLVPNFDNLTDEEKDIKTEKLAIATQNKINKDLNTYMGIEAFKSNNKGSKFDIKTECVIRAAYYRATRRYAQWITKEEGIDKESLNIKGLEFMKSNFPPIMGKFFKNMVSKALKNATQKEILDDVKNFKDDIINGKIPIYDLGNPTSVKKIRNYIGISPRAGEMFTIIKKGAPAPVKAAIKYNDLLKFWNLDKYHKQITMADKIKWFYLKDNPYKIDSLAFVEGDTPNKIKEFLNTYVDRRKVFDNVLLNKLEGFFSDFEWRLDLNPYATLLDY